MTVHVAGWKVWTALGVLFVAVIGSAWYLGSLYGEFDKAAMEHQQLVIEDTNQRIRMIELQESHIVDFVDAAGKRGISNADRLAKLEAACLIKR